MKKRKCTRFFVPGATLYYKQAPLFFFFKGKYSQDYFPVVDMSKGGAMFLSHQRLTPGKGVDIRLNIPGKEQTYEIKGDIRWIARNPEQSYAYRTGISFRSFGSGHRDNSTEILSFLKELEAEYT